MKVTTKQKSAKAWSNALNKINEAQFGQIAITYKGDDGKKQVGYQAITDIELEIGTKKITFGTLLGGLIKSNNELNKENQRLKGLVDSNSKEIKKIQEILVKYLPNITI